MFRETSLIHIVTILLLSILLCISHTQSRAQKIERSPSIELSPSKSIVTVGHGAMLDAQGKEVVVTPELVDKTQEFYIKQLLSRANNTQREVFKAKRQQILDRKKWDRKDQVNANSALIDWLIKEVNPNNAATLVHANTLLSRQFAKHVKKMKPKKITAPVELLPSQDLSNLLESEGLLTTLSATEAGGTDYINECQDAGVPIPPDWGSAQWQSRGILSNEFILENQEAEVFVFESSSPRGICIALPRSTGSNISALGIICQGNDTSKACFWDSANIPKGSNVPLTDFVGGADLLGGNGVCTDCHAGRNPFIIHPGTPLDIGAIAKPDNWYEPLVHPSWPQNPGPTNILDNISLGPDDQSCLSCHSTSVAGRFPAVSTKLPGYCGTILATAVQQTMPPGSVGNSAFEKHIQALENACLQEPKPAVTTWSGRIWKHTGVACSDESCPGWEKLDNNVRTVSLTAGNGKLYQLHYNGLIWESTGMACKGETCPGWRKLDNNPKTIAIVTGGDRLYQLHNDGLIWQYSGTPCSGNSCPGWRKLDNNPRTVSIAASGDKLYQMHRDGKIWVATGTACSGNNCPGWRMLDNNPRSIAIAATDNKLFQLHHDGRIWEHTGTPCSGNSCPGWRLLDNNVRTVDISVNNGKLFQRHRDGTIWKHTGTPCSGQSCPGWTKLDNNPRSTAVNGGLYQDHHDGRIWKATGAACSGNSCLGWRMLDNNPRTKFSLAADSDNDKLYQLHAPKLYQLHNNGAIWQSTGHRCDGDSCGGWQKLDNNPHTKAITASAGKLFQLHDNGKIWQATGKPCDGDSCPGWRMIDNNPRTKAIVSAGGQLYQLHDNGKIWRFKGKSCNGNSCPSWVMLDNNPRTKAIVAGGGQLYQLHDNGKIWRFTGKVCSGNSCPGWVMIDNNSRTRTIAAAGGKLYQLHNNGKIWEHTGKACSGNSCPGWRMMDNNTRTVDIVGGRT